MPFEPPLLPHDSPLGAASGEPSAELFTRLFSKEFPYVWASLRRLGVRERDVEDVAHEVFIKVYAKLGQFDPSRSPRAWLYGFAFRAASDYRRLARHKVLELGDDFDAPQTDVPPADEALARREEASLVARALGAIDLDKRAVLIAYELDETPMKDIAEALEIPVNTAYSRLRLAREEFASAVERIRLKEGHVASSGGGRRR